MVLLLLIEIVGRPWYGYVILGSQILVRQLTMWLALLGAALAAREGRLLALATGTFIHNPRVRHVAEVAAAAAAAAVAVILCVGGIRLVLEEREFGTPLTAGLQAWMSQIVLPVGFALIAVHIVMRVGGAWKLRAFAALGLIAGELTLGGGPRESGGRQPGTAARGSAFP